jgi:hypothetical protein
MAMPGSYWLALTVSSLTVMRSLHVLPRSWDTRTNRSRSPLKPWTVFCTASLAFQAM